VIAPGLRTGWIDVDPRIRSLAVNAKQAMDTCSNVPAQHALTRYLESDHLDEHLARLIPIYRERKDAMRASLERHFGDRVVSTDPEGGLFLWLSFAGEAAGIDTEQLFPDALREGVAYIPGPAFTVDGSMRNALRLCFATSSPERIELGVARLARVVERAMQS
jgi:2-aminoadipate transaminase